MLFASSHIDQGLDALGMEVKITKFRGLDFYSISYIDGLVQDCSNSSAFAMELLQSCNKTSIL